MIDLDKIREKVKEFTDKYGVEPNVTIINPKDFDELVRADLMILRSYDLSAIKGRGMTDYVIASKDVGPTCANSHIGGDPYGFMVGLCDARRFNAYFK